jgi:hypothetical protein
VYNQVTIYVVWKDGSPHAEIGRTLWTWFNHIDANGLASPAGIPVYFRSQLKNGELTPAIDPGDEVRRPLNLVLLLIDEGWVASGAWSKVPDQLAGRSDVVLFHLALHPEAGATADLLDTRQAIMADAADKDVLRRAVTQAFAQAVRRSSGFDDGPMKIFVSHAKQDGRVEGRELAAAIGGYGQLQAYFDERDIAWGSDDWADQLQQAVRKGSAGMIVQETDAYASRPWCRAEAEMARTPVCGERGTPLERVWSVLPTVVVCRPEDRWSKVLPELGNVPRIGAIGDFATKAIDHLVREILLSAVNRLRASAVALARPDTPCQVITWSPDPETIRHVRRAVGWDAHVVYPGHGLYRFEEARLLKLDHNVSRSQPCLHTYADWVHRGPSPQQRPRLPANTIVAVSISDSPERAKLGFGADHENATLTTWTTELVRAGARVVYGGIVATKDDTSGDNKLTPIVNAVVAHARGREAGESFPKPPPLINVQAFPFYRGLTSEFRAANKRVCQFVLVDPPGWTPDNPGSAERDRRAAQGTPEWMMWAATALSEMRRVMARGAALDDEGQVVPQGALRLPPTTLRIAVGGKFAGYLGKMPGIAEEYLEDRLAGRPVLPLARYGGCAGRLVQALLAPSGEPLPEELTWGWASEQTWYLGLAALDTQLGLQARWAQLAAQLEADRQALADGRSWISGMDAGQVRELMRSDRDAQVIYAVLAALG